MAGSFKTSQERIGALIRVIGLLCIILGISFVYFISQTILIPQLIPIFYFLAALLIFVGATVIIAKFD